MTMPWPGQKNWVNSELSLAPRQGGCGHAAEWWVLKSGGYCLLCKEIAQHPILAWFILKREKARADRQAWVLSEGKARARDAGGGRGAPVRDAAGGTRRAEPA